MAVNYEEFIISEESLQKINTEDVLSEHLKGGKPLQELFGFSNETTAEFYDAAKNILEQKRFKEAVHAFVFLTTMNPYISDFWVGLGMAEQKDENHDSALFAYSVAFELEGNKIFSYVLAAQCCMEINDFEKAIEVLECAEKYAEENSDDEECKQLKEDAIAAKHYVFSQKKKTGY